MLINKSTYIIGDNVILVPYKEIHVSRYHEWMKNEELQKLTASEPLSLQQEYEMQQTWLNSDDKCTFIVLDRAKYFEGQDEIAAMIGDTNLFLMDNPKIAEAEVMIAEPSARGQHRGWEAMILMLRYGMENLTIEEFVAKIGFENSQSINMFRKIGFEEVEKSEVFKEITLKKIADSQFLSWLRSASKDSKVASSLNET